MLAGIDPTVTIMLALLGSATLFGAVAGSWFGGWLYLAPILWALSAIIDKNLHDGDPIITYAAGGAAIVLVITRLLFFNKKAS